MNELYPTSEAARILEVSASTIRTWKSRQAKRFIEGNHFIKDEAGAVLWTEAGLGELRLIASQGDSKTETSPVSESEGGILQRYDLLLDEIAEAIAPRLMDSLDRKVAERLVSTSRQPVNAVVVLQSLGLKPANLSGLLEGSDD